MTDTHTERIAAMHEQEEAARRTEATRWLNGLLAQLDDPTASDDGALGDGTGTYDADAPRLERFMVGVNGPTAWLCFVLDDEGALSDAWLELTDSRGTTHVMIPDHRQEELLTACRADQYAQRDVGYLR